MKYSWMLAVVLLVPFLFAKGFNKRNKNSPLDQKTGGYLQSTEFVVMKTGVSLGEFGHTIVYSPLIGFTAKNRNRDHILRRKQKL
ncbi:MAG: hypothetical protein HXS46_15145 [Theionarchaea archaeon]|nr:hypothetical protein [Theionarchaea archaeon]